MTFNYRVGLFRIWVVLSLFWVIVAALAGGMPWGAVIGPPLVFGIVLYLVIWVTRGFTKVQPTPALSFDLRELRKNLVPTCITQST